MLALEYKEIMQAITSLSACRNTLEEVHTVVKQSAYESSSTEEKLADSWYRINVCRLFTETDVNMEGHLQTAMGLIVDAKEMVNSLAAWRKGLTVAGRGNILTCIREAMMNIITVQEQLESMLNGCR